MAKKKDPAAVSLGRRGGKARAKKLTKKELQEQAKKAINARWEKCRQDKAKKEGV